jgi:hypothetical protein
MWQNFLKWLLHPFTEHYKVTNIIVGTKRTHLTCTRNGITCLMTVDKKLEYYEPSRFHVSVEFIPVLKRCTYKVSFKRVRI